MVMIASRFNQRDRNERNNKPRFQGGGSAPSSGGSTSSFITPGKTLKIIDIEAEMGIGSFSGGAFIITGTNPWNRGGYSTSNPSLTTTLLGKLAAAGFNTICHIFDTGPLVFALNAGDMTTFNRLMAQLQANLTAATNAGFKSIARFTERPITSVQATGVGLADTEIIGAAPNGPFWTNYLNMLSKACAFIAANNQPADVAVEPFNEPPGSSWNGLAPQVWATCRSVAPNHTIIIQCQLGGSAAGIVGLNASQFDANTMFCFHSYDPYNFVFQSQIGAPNSIQYVSGMEWPPVPANQAGIISAATTRINADGGLTGPQKTAAIAAMTGAVNIYYSQPRDQTFTNAIWGQVITWADTNGVARNRITLGEFSCGYTSVYNYTGCTGAPTTSMQAYLNYLTDYCAANGINWGYFSLMDAQTFGNNFTLAPGFPPVVSAGNAVLTGLRLNTVI